MKNFLILLTFFLLASCGKSDVTSADLIIENARVYTFSWSEPSLEGMPANDAPYNNNKWLPDAEAIAIKAGKIIFVGSNQEVAAYKSDDTELIDAKSAIVLPGLIESHGHVHEIGEWNEELDLRNLSGEEIIEKVYQRSLKTPEGEWIIGAGWDEAIFADNYPDMIELSRKVAKHPVVLNGMRGFGVLGNNKALELAGISTKTRPPLGGEILMEGNQKMNVLLNNAKYLLTSKVPPKSFEQKERILKYSLNELARAGYVTTHHAGVRSDYMPVYEAIRSKGELPIRVHAMIATTEANKVLVDEWIEKGPTSDPEDFLQVRSFKAFYDGSLGSRGANLLSAYSDMPQERGVGGMEYGFDSTVVRDVMQAGFQLAIHCIGDAGNRDVLDFYERSFELRPELRNKRHRIEHAQIVHPEDFPRFKALNIIASMEPAHAVEDMPWAIDRVGEDRIKGAYSWRTLRRNGTDIIFNSDFAGTDYNFFYGVHSAVTRKKRDEADERTWQPEQAFTIEETIRAYTVWGAYASQQERLTGTIEKGKWADLTFIDIDILNIGQKQPAKLLSGNILRTIVNGKTVYRADN